VARPVGDLTPPVRGLPSPPQAPSTRRTCLPVKGAAGSHPAVKAGSGQHQPRTQAGQGGSPGRRRPPAPLPCYLQRTVFRALIATAGWTGVSLASLLVAENLSERSHAPGGRHGATVIRPAQAELVPEPMDQKWPARPFQEF